MINSVKKNTMLNNNTFKPCKCNFSIQTDLDTKACNFTVQQPTTAGQSPVECQSLMAGFIGFMWNDEA